MSQELRNKIYALAGAVGVVVIVLGLGTQGDVDAGKTLLDQWLAVVSGVVTLGSATLAFVKSLSSRTTTIDVPKAQVDTVATTNGDIIAGPANPAPTGTVLSPNLDQQAPGGQ